MLVKLDHNSLQTGVVARPPGLPATHDPLRLDAAPHQSCQIRGQPKTKVHKQQSHLVMRCQAFQHIVALKKPGVSDGCATDDVKNINGHLRSLQLSGVK